MTFTREELKTYLGRTLPDLIPSTTRLLIVGINPGLLTVAVQAHFARRGNRFYKALHLAGITDHVIDASEGYKPEDVAELKGIGIGITCIVPGATARADELTPVQLREGGIALRRRVENLRPNVVAMLGVTAYRTAFGEPRAVVGRQPMDWGSSEVWVVPNPSGLNAHSTVADLAEAYREVAVAAGIPVSSPS